VPPPPTLPAKIVPIDDAQRREARETAAFVWTIDITLPGSERSAAAVGRLLWALGTALELIPGTVVDVVDVKNGSIRAKLQVYIKNIWSRDEVQEAFAKARDGVVATYSGKPVAEVELLHEEKEKLAEERRTIERERQRLPNAKEAAELRSLELDERR